MIKQIIGHLFWFFARILFYSIVVVILNYIFSDGIEFKNAWHIGAFITLLIDAMAYNVIKINNEIDKAIAKGGEDD